MRSGNMLPREALDSLTEQERVEFEIRATIAVYAIDEELGRLHGGSAGSGWNLLLGDPQDYIPEAKKRLRGDDRPADFENIDDLMKAFSVTATRIMQDRIRDARGDTRKVIRVDENKKIKLIRPSRPAQVTVVYERDVNRPTNLIAIDLLAKPEYADEEFLLQAPELSDEATRHRFLQLLICEIRSLGTKWSERLARIFELCREWPETWLELVTVNDQGQLSFKVKRIAFVLEESTQDISNALRHLATLAEELRDPGFQKMIAKAVAAGNE